MQIYHEYLSFVSNKSEIDTPTSNNVSWLHRHARWNNGNSDFELYSVISDYVNRLRHIIQLQLAEPKLTYFVVDH